MSIPHLKIATIVASAVAAFCGAAITIPPAWSILGLPEVVFKSEMHRAVAELKIAAAEDRKVVSEIQIEVLESRRQAIDRDVFDQKQRLKAVHDPDVEYRLHERERELQIIDMRLIDLRKLK